MNSMALTTTATWTLWPSAAYDLENDTVDVTLVLENGDHLHLILAPAALENLSRHIEYAISQRPAQTVRPKRKK